jgi:predicted metal-dependent phosphoesterase TrpH
MPSKVRCAATRPGANTPKTPQASFTVRSTPIASPPAASTAKAPGAGVVSALQSVTRSSPAKRPASPATRPAVPGNVSPVIDLHTHSVASDGTDQPERIPELAAAAGCQAVALTDHDTLAGLPAARRRAGELGIELVPGCEISCSFRGTSAHVLVYFVEDEEGPLQDELARLREDRVARNRRLAERLAELGSAVTYDEVVAEASHEESVGRPHFAAVLVRHGEAESVPDAFDRWLARGRPAYVPKARVAPAAIAEAAAGSGSVAVLAHPLSLGLTGSELESAVAELAEAGFTGLEALYGRYTPGERKGLARLAKRFGLVATGGSDYHGAVKPDLSICSGQGDLRVPYTALEQLRDRRAG